MAGEESGNEILIKNLCGEFEVDAEEDEMCKIKMETVKILGAEDERSVIYVRDIDGTTADGTFASCKIETEDDDYKNKEYILQLQGESLKQISRECKIMYEPNPPTAIVEYCFAEDDVWRLSNVSEDACTHYIGSKFKNWQEMIKNPTCEAALRRMVEIGLITTIFDPLAFPNPVVENKDEDPWLAKDDRGKYVNIPHPVKALRIWNTDTQSYADVAGRLVGAPPVEEEAQYWGEMMAYLREHFPEEMERVEAAIKKSEETN